MQLASKDVIQISSAAQKDEKIHVAVIGVGRWGREHIRVFSEIEEANLSIICDINEEVAKAISQELGIDYCYDIEELLETEKIDLVTIATPIESHFSLAKRLLENGISVLVENPLVETIKEAQELQKIAQDNNTYIFNSFLERFNDTTIYIRKAILNNSLGPIVTVTARRLGPSSPPREKNIGILKELAIHEIDIMRFLLQNKPEYVFGVAGTRTHDFQDFAQIMMHFENDCTSFIEANWLSPGKIRTITVTGEKALLRGNYLTQKVFLEEEGGLWKVNSDWREPLKVELSHLIRVVACKNKEVQPMVTINDYIQALEIVEAAIESIEKSKPIFLQ